MTMSTLRTAAASFLLVPTIAVAQAPTGIELENASFTEHSAAGTCGPAKVEISGVDVENHHETRRLIRDYGASIQIASGVKSLVIGDGGDASIVLQNQNKLHCVATPTGSRLILAAHCFSNYCLPVSYTVIDPASLHVLSKGVDGECDAACAEKALGTSLPVDLRRTEL